MTVKKHTEQTTSTIIKGGSRIFEKGVYMYKGVGVRFADFI